MNIQPISFVDPSLFAATLLLKYQKHFADDRRRQEYQGSPHHDTECIVLRGPDEPTPENWFQDVEHVDYPLLKEWVAARSLIAAAEIPIAQTLGVPAPVLGKIMVVSLKAGGTIDWHVDEGAYAQNHMRFHLGINVSAGAWLYSGGEAQQIGAGNLVFFNNLTTHSAANFGPVPRIHLIIDVRKPTKQ